MNRKLGVHWLLYVTKNSNDSIWKIGASLGKPNDCTLHVNYFWVESTNAEIWNENNSFFMLQNYFTFHRVVVNEVNHLWRFVLISQFSEIFLLILWIKTSMSPRAFNFTDSLNNRFILYQGIAFRIFMMCINLKTLSFFLVVSCCIPDFKKQL